MAVAESRAAAASPWVFVFSVNLTHLLFSSRIEMMSYLVQSMQEVTNDRRKWL